MNENRFFDDESVARIGFTHRIESDGSIVATINAAAMKEISLLAEVGRDNAGDVKFDSSRKVFMAAITQFAIAIGEHHKILDPETMTCVTHAMTFLYPRMGISPTASKVVDDGRIDDVMEDVIGAVKESADVVRQGLIDSGKIKVTPEDKIVEAMNRAKGAMDNDEGVFIISSGPEMWEATKARIDAVSARDGVVFFSTMPALRAAVRESPRNMVEVLLSVTRVLGMKTQVKPSVMLNCVAHLGAELAVELSQPKMRETAVTEFAGAVTRIGKIILNMDKPAGHA